MVHQREIMEKEQRNDKVRGREGGREIWWRNVREIVRERERERERENIVTINYG